jgi:hypothetical protein
LRSKQLVRTATLRVACGDLSLARFERKLTWLGVGLLTPGVTDLLHWTILAVIKWWVF